MPPASLRSLRLPLLGLLVVLPLAAHAQPRLPDASVAEPPPEVDAAFAQPSIDAGPPVAATAPDAGLGIDPAPVPMQLAPQNDLPPAAPLPAPALGAPPPALPPAAPPPALEPLPTSTDVGDESLAAPPAGVPADEPVDITIVGTSMRKTGGSAHSIREKQLERFEYDDPHAILLQVPGVYIRQEDGFGLRPNIGFRGANPDRSKKLTLMEDGVLFGPAPYSAPAAYFFPLMTRMTGVRIIKGPAAVAYGPQTVAGAIDLSSRDIPSRPSGAVDLGVGEYGYGKAHAYFGASTEKFGFSVEGVHLRNTGFYELPNDGNTGARRNEWVMKGAYNPDPYARVRNEFGIKLTYSDELSNESYLGLTDADFRANPYRRYPAAALDQMDLQRTSVVLSHKLTGPSHGLELKTQAYRHDFERSWNKLNRFGATLIGPVLRNPDYDENRPYYAVLSGAADSGGPGPAGPGPDTLFIGPNARTFVSQGIQSVLSLKAATGPLSHRIEAGLRLHHDSIRRRHSEDAYLMSGGRLVPAGTKTDITTNNKASTVALATHLIAASTWRDLTITPGVRIEIIDSQAEDYLAKTKSDRLTVGVMPGISAYYSLIKPLGLLAGVHRGFSPPPPGSSSEVDPEYSVNYEAGSRFTSGKIRLEAIGFYNAYSNLTTICTFSSGCVDADLDRQTDAGRARIFGVEVFGAHEPSWGQIKVPITAAYTYSRGEFLSNYESQDPIYGSGERGDDLPYIPRHQLNTTLGLETRWFGGALALNYISEMREEPGDEPLSRAWTTDDQFWLDLEAHAKVVGPVLVYVNARNLLGAENLVARRPYGARVNAPQWIQVGAKVRY